MNFTVNKNHILDVLSKIQGLTGRKSTLAITANVLIRTVSNGINIIATDLETGFEGTYPAKVETEGSIAINSRKLFEIVRDFPDEDIHINEVENHWVEIGNKNVEYHIVGMNPEDFPDIPKIMDIPFLHIDSLSLKKMIEKSIIITGTSDDQRAHITGVYFEMMQDTDKKIVRIVSTDGSRLSKADYIYDKDVELPPGSGILIPKKGLNEVTKFLAPAGTVQIGFKDNHFIVQKDVETIMIRLLEGAFPNYSEILANLGGHVIKVENQLFLMMLRRMSILASDNYRAVIFNFSDDKLVITSTNPDIGESKEEMIISFEGESIEVAFNPRFFIEALNAIDDDTVIINIVDEEKPCLLEGETEKSYLSAIMPMRV